MNLVAKNILKQKKKRLKRKVAVVNLKTAKTALIVYDATKKDEEKKVRDFARFFKEEGIKTDTIAVYKSKNKEDLKPDDELGYIYYDKKDLNWLGFPANKKILKCIAKDYNLLLDLNLNSEFSLSVITTLSTANFKVGKSGDYQNDVCDLTLAIEENNLDYLMEQIVTYLRMINKN